MIDFAAHIERQEEWTRTLAADPGWRDYIEHKARGMAKKYPELYSHLPAIVKATPVTQKESPSANR